MNEAKLIKYLKEFKKSDHLKKLDWLEDQHKFFKKFFKRENLEKLQWKDVQELGEYIHSFKSLALAKKRALGKPNHLITHYRKSFIYLVYGDGDDAFRFSEFHNGKYKLKYWGESAVSELIGHAFPNKYILLNSRDQLAIEFFELDLHKVWGDSFGEKYTKFNQAIKPVIELYKEIVGQQTKTTIPLEVDQFFSYLYEQGLLKNEIDDIAETKNNAWIYSPGRQAKNWEESYEKSEMSLGWDKIGNINELKDKESIKKKAKIVYDDNPIHITNACYDFYKNIKIGDSIFVKKGVKKLIGHGIVESDYIYDDSRNGYKHVRRVNWTKKGEWKIPDDNKFPIKALTNITSDQNRVSKLREILFGNGNNNWIFQANPSVWDLDTALDKLGKDSWTATRYKKEMKAGDKIYFWKSGSEAGLYGIGTIIGSQNNSEKAKRDKVDVIYNEKLKAPITREAFSNNPILKESLIITAPQGSNFRLSSEEAQEIEKLIISQNLMSLPMDSLNTILYGPPGTGKTYKLSNEYFPMFTDRKTQDKEEYLESLVKNYSWWQVVGAVLSDLKSASVPQILSHELIQAQIKTSNTNSALPTIWQQLQLRTPQECEYVNTTQRLEPAIFSKNSDSIWTIDAEKVETETPEILDLLEKSKQTPETQEDVKRYEFITFHQSYSYEEFIEGIRPITDENGAIRYEVVSGVFKKLAKKAIKNPDKNFALFIDEINRGNISKIFGELITLIEEDKRIGAKNELKVRLSYSGDEFGVPSNLYVIGTMNTADRSIALVDIALRRRFVFEGMEPDETLVHEKYQALFVNLNQKIIGSIGPDYQIGHSYFMEKDGNGFDIEKVMNQKVIPLLNEYFYNDIDSIEEILRSVGVSLDQEAKEKKRIVFEEYKQLDSNE